MKKILILLVLMASIVWGRTLITYQDFEGSQFPPQDWENNGWTREGTSNHWASFHDHDFEHCGLSIYTDSGTPTSITLTYGWVNYTVYRDTAVSGFVSFQDYGDDGISYINLHERSHYKIEFKAKKEGGEWPTGYVQLDNVRITECATPIEPSSLGKVKAIFK